MKNGLFLCALAASANVLILTAAAHAQDLPDDADLQAVVQRLLVEQAELRNRIAWLEAQQRGSDTSIPASTAAAVTATDDVVVIAGPPSPLARNLDVYGDFRLRYEANSLVGPDRHRMVMRARIAANYAPASWLTLGARLATGDPGDPNSTDVTIGGFDDDLDVSLDRAFVRAEFGDITLQGGKFDNPLAYTEMVWDGDVGIAGLHARVRPAPAFTVDALYFAIDEDIAGDDSRLIGGQARWSPTLANNSLKADLAFAYLDYRIAAIGSANSGDIRTNRLANEQYLSDFDLVAAYASLSSEAFGARWPVSVTAQYVQNLGAPSWSDEGVSFEIWVGRNQAIHDWRINYGYTSVDADAVFAAFSSDNIPVGSDYLQHRVAMDYVIADNIFANATLYHYRSLNTASAMSLPQEWEDRLRLNVMLAF